MLRFLLLLALGFADGGVPGPGPAPARARAAATLPTLLAPIPPEPGAAPDAEFRLLRAKDGTGDLLYDAPGFAGRVARDGSVTFHDKHLSGINLLPVLPGLSSSASGAGPTGLPTVQMMVRGIGKKLRKAPSAARPDRTDDETRWPSKTVSRYRPDTREACQYPRPCFFDASVLLLGVQARFDVTDELMRFAGQDPYRYEKARFLTATRELRIRMAGRAHAEDVNRSVASLPRLLDTIACDDRLSAGERRAIIEALRAELDVATPEARSYSEAIRRFVDVLGHGDGGAHCPAR